MIRRPSTRRVGQLARRAANLPVTELLTTMYAAFVLLVVELLIRWVPLTRLSRILGVPVDLSPASARSLSNQPEIELSPRSRMRLRSTNRVVDRWPFCKGPCLRRALITGHLLRAQRPAIRLGTAGTGSTLRAHAWVEIDGRPLEDVAGYTVLRIRPEGRTS